MDEYDEPLTVELKTDRELAVFMFVTGLGAKTLQHDNRLAGAQAVSNLQIRLASADPDRLCSALSEYGTGGVMNGMGEMSTEAAISSLASEEETDPDEATNGML